MKLYASVYERFLYKSIGNNKQKKLCLPNIISSMNIKRVKIVGKPFYIIEIIDMLTQHTHTNIYIHINIY